MRERTKMLLSIPLWVPLALVGLLTNALYHPQSFWHYWDELWAMLRWAWDN